MFPFSIPLLLVAAFLVLTLVVGFTSKNPTTFRAYAVDNQQVSTFRLVVTVLATTFDSTLLINRVGVHHNTVNFFSSIPVLFYIPLILQFIALFWVRMVPFMKHFSVIETIGKVYGQYPRVIAGLFCILYCIEVVFCQITSIYFIISICIDSVDPKCIGILVTLVVVLYAALGGIRSVTNSDMLQGIIFISIISLIARLMFLKTGQSILEVLSFLHKKERLAFNSLFNCDIARWKFFLFFPYCALRIYDPTVLHRVYMCSSPLQVKKVFFYSSLVACLIIFFLWLIGLFIFVVNPTLSITEIWQYIVAGMPFFLQGLVVICVLGLAMSTADSYLHLCSVVVGHDLMESIRRAKPVSDKLRIQVSKWTIVIVGLLLMILVWYDNRPLECTGYSGILSKRGIYIFCFFQCSLSTLFILALFGFRSTSSTAFIGMTTFMLFCWIALQLGCNVLLFIIIASSVTSILTMLAAHYLLPQPTGKGWVGLNAQQKRLVELTGLFRKFKKKLHIE
ncbi:sodium:solute symporter family protein [Candidatus Cardinium hertigii]|uniref:sodium:solute symporter family protein n=1 Tax=Candidatus Cardinium hertigii TaxID=247481 RepID=UPI003D7D865C